MLETCSPIPGFNEVIFSIGPIAIRWYALAYIAGLVLGWRYYLRLVKNPGLWTSKANPTAKDSPMTSEDVDELLFLATLGVILGGRLAHSFIYAPLEALGQGDTPWFMTGRWQDLFYPFKIWQGGMAFHGGLLGVGLAIWWLARQRKISFLNIADGAAIVTPIGLLFGRIANFINGELYGRPWDGPWAMVFPCDRVQPPVPRHPSQLYEAGLEGLALGLIMLVASRQFKILRRPGLATGIFLIGYGAFRSIVENFRMPDEGLTNLPLGITMGQVLSTPMWIGGVALIAWAVTRPPVGARQAGAKRTA
ncbi:MAG: prolipoprotein diacylglyceryl transferase [Maricaulaceae bacterium]|jgi:phosphatidylglycerol:prolipoprotein diacylglycerol transferase